MKRSVMATAVTVLAIAASSTAASAEATQYYVTKFDATPQARMAFAVRSRTVDKMVYRAPLRCRTDGNDGVISGEAKDARISRDGRFVSRTTYGARGTALTRVRGSGFPGSPNGFFRARFDLGRNRPCDTGQLHWIARQVTVDAWRKYRRNQIGFGR